MESLISQHVVSDMSESMRQETGEAVGQEIEAAKQNVPQVQVVGDTSHIKLFAKLIPCYSELLHSMWCSPTNIQKRRKNGPLACCRLLQGYGQFVKG